jgi:hypothetical protein
MAKLRERPTTTMGRRPLGVLAASILSLSAGAAAAQTEGESPPVPPPHHAVPQTTVLLTPNLMGPFADLTIERRVAPWLGVAVLGGYGAARTRLFDPIPMFEFGAQGRLHYSRPVGTTMLSDVGFGAQLSYEHARESEPIIMSPFQTPPGWAATPFVFVESLIGGFTMTYETGFAFMLTAEPTTRDFISHRVGWFERIGLGWSFD